MLYGVIYHIRREASALLVLLQWAFQSLEKRDEQLVWLSRFFCLIFNHYPGADGTILYYEKDFIVFASCVAVVNYGARNSA